MEFCDTSSEAKQEGLIPVTIQGFVILCNESNLDFDLKLCLRIVPVLMLVPASITPLPWSLTFLLFVLKISLLFVILNLHYICLCISAIFSVFLLMCKYFNMRIQFKSILLHAAKRVKFFFRSCLEGIPIVKFQTRATRHYFSSRNTLY